ncbi:hypothetical protein BDB00DRAFT_845326 [Zychaea mexicana]|uniref:uncharacterized protein n=1 Tax=Zychaea mexicana TaxID=64656 RepID=UPI0022FE3A86|nr:uncharacterized protein BDB00DRAFT_845326 [Zychaea mexicana]KAI9489030.1 hypothetical protein BDB00DRAFT_845326 [Zychaea mexicana]
MTGDSTTQHEQGQEQQQQQQQQQEDQQRSLLDRIHPLDDEQVRHRVQAVIQDRNQRMKEAFSKMYHLLQQVVDLIQAYANAQDQLALQEMEHELGMIHMMETQQERLRDQIVRFIQATSSSFEEIFSESPTPPPSTTASTTNNNNNNNPP